MSAAVYELINFIIKVKLRDAAYSSWSVSWHDVVVVQDRKVPEVKVEKWVEQNCVKSLVSLKADAERIRTRRRPRINEEKEC